MAVSQLLANSKVRDLTIEKCESLVARRSYLHDMTLNLTTLSTEDCCLGKMKLVSSLPRLSLDDINFDDGFVSEPVYGATLASQKMIKNLAGNSVQAMIYCSVENGKPKTLVEVGCWDGTVKEFRALLDTPAKQWPSFNECTTPPSKERIAETRQRYLAWLEDNLKTIDQEFEGLQP